MKIASLKKSNLITYLMFCLVLVGNSSLYAGAKDGGGGNFTKGKFWYIVERYIVPELIDYKQKENKKISTEQIDKILSKMDEKLIKVEITDEDLYTYENGKKELVDAKNYPKENRIELNKASWNARLDSGFSYYYLILHEFMGLAQVPDKNSVVSRSILPPEKLEISFKANELTCFSSIKYVQLLKDKNSEKFVDWILRDAPSTNKKVVLGKVQKLNENPKCQIKDEKSGKCFRYIQNYKIKTALANIPVNWFPIDSGSDPVDFGLDYQIELDIALLGDYYTYGYGGASNVLYKEPAMFEVHWKVYQNTDDGSKRLVHSSQTTSFESNPYGNELYVEVKVVLPELETLMNKNSYRLGYGPYNGELASKYRSYNIVGSLYSIARQSGGLERQIDQDRYIVENILRDAKQSVLPFRLHLGCTLHAPN